MLEPARSFDRRPIGRQTTIVVAHSGREGVLVVAKYKLCILFTWQRCFHDAQRQAFPVRSMPFGPVLSKNDHSIGRANGGRATSSMRRNTRMPVKAGATQADNTIGGPARPAQQSEEKDR